MDLYHISCELPVQPDRPDNKPFVTSALWRNYIGTWKLHADGRLELIEFEFPRVNGDESSFQQVNDGFVVGNFTINLRPFFYGPHTVVPFVDGVIVENRARWEIDETIHAVVLEHKPFGLICDYGFIPRSFLKSENVYTKGDTVACSAFKLDREHRQLVLKPLAEAVGG